MIQKQKKLPGLVELVLQTILAFTQAKGKLRVAQETVIRVSSFAIIDETIVNLLQQRRYDCEVSSELFLGTTVSNLVEIVLSSLDSILEQLAHARSSFAKEVAHSSFHNKKLKQTQVVRIVVELGDEKGDKLPRYSVINLVNLVDFEIGYLLQHPEEPGLATQGRSLYALMQTFAHLTQKTRKVDHSSQSPLEISQLTLYLKPMLENNGKVGVLFCISGNVHDYGVNITTLWQYKNWLKFNTIDLPNTKNLRGGKTEKIKKDITKTEGYIAISSDVSFLQDPRLSQASKQTFIREKFANELKLSQLNCQIQKPGKIYPLFLSAKQILEIENQEERERAKSLKMSLIERLKKVLELLKQYSAHQSEFDLLKPMDFGQLDGLPDYLLQQTDPFQDFADTEDRKSELIDYGIDADRDDIPRASLCFQNIRDHQLETILEEIEDGISESPESRSGSFIFFDKLASIVSMQDDNPFNR